MLIVGLLAEIKINHRSAVFREYKKRTPGSKNLRLLIRYLLKGNNKEIRTKPSDTFIVDFEKVFSHIYLRTFLSVFFAVDFLLLTLKRCSAIYA